MKIIECPRDAMQGIEDFIPTAMKVSYLNQLLKVGFDTLDFGSFVSPKAIPQMKDTAAVVDQLDLSNSKTKLLAIVANTRGAQEALAFDRIAYLGFPLSISETFQQRNTNKSIVEALNTLEEMQNLCLQKNKTLVTYISMGFGNPYNDPYDTELVAKFVDILSTLGVEIISLADTIGNAKPNQIESLFKSITKGYGKIEFGVHLHAKPDAVIENIEAAYNAGCRRFDGALKGYGGCPMAKDELIGNMPTESIVSYLVSKDEKLGINEAALQQALTMSSKVFIS